MGFTQYRIWYRRPDNNWIWAASLGLPVGETQNIKLTWQSGRSQNLVGRDSDNLLLSWSMRWGH